MKRTTCSGCGYDDLRMFLDLRLSPVADAYTSAVTTVSPTYPLQLAVCTGCWLVQLLEVVDHNVLFGTGYSFYSSASPPLSQYHANYARDVIQRHSDRLRIGAVVEIGCNDGDMLHHFHDAGFTAVGVDPSGGPVARATARGLSVINAPFTVDIGRAIQDRYGSSGVVIANHVLAHVEDVSSVLAGIGELLDPAGVAMIEVQYLPDLLVNNAFDLVYHEHRNFFSLSSLEKAAERHGLYVADAELTDRQGGSLRVTLLRRRVPNSRVDAIRASEGWLTGLSAYEGFQGRVERIRTRLRDVIASLLSDGAVIAGYGAPAKATTLLNFCGLSNDALSFVVDTTIAKQGRFIPGTGIPVVSPESVSLSGIDVFVLLSWNYASQIIRGVNAAGYAGKWLVPIPTPVLL